MEHRVDVHVLHMPAENKIWADICNESLANEPINIHHLPGIYGQLREARYRGFNQGTAEYVSFVDPDDYVEPGIFQQCIDVLDANPTICGVYTLSSILHENGTVTIHHPYREYGAFVEPRPLEIHQLTVMRRDSVMRAYSTNFDQIPQLTGDMQWIYWTMAAKAPWIAIPTIGYNWRSHQYNNNKLMGMMCVGDMTRVKYHILNTWRTICNTG